MPTNYIPDYSVPKSLFFEIKSSSNFAGGSAAGTMATF
jgi:hypothetical protein